MSGDEGEISTVCRLPPPQMGNCFHSSAAERTVAVAAAATIALKGRLIMFIICSSWFVEYKRFFAFAAFVL